MANSCQSLFLFAVVFSFAIINFVESTTISDSNTTSAYHRQLKITQIYSGEKTLFYLSDGSFIDCTKSQKYFHHPFDGQKYLVCVKVGETDRNEWWLKTMDCAPGSKWNQPTQSCIKN